ncbi:hypothetical protein FBU30_000783 [Linnemannia zychae]|nr:hypothetical protein FBU30_000783 [Linnemannia zychae]
MPLFKRHPVPVSVPPSNQQYQGGGTAGYYTRPSPMTRLKLMLRPRRGRHTHHTSTGAGTNPVAAAEREGRRIKRFFRRQAHAVGAPAATGHPRHRKGLFSRRHHPHHGTAGTTAPVAGGGAYSRHRSPLGSLRAMFSRKRYGPRHAHGHHGGIQTAGGQGHYVA